MIRALFVSLVLAPVIVAGGALACSCIRFPNAAAELQATDLMFIGRAEATTTQRRDGGTLGVTRFTVQRTLKGDARSVQSIEHSVQTGGMCGVVFTRGRTYTVMASIEGGRLMTGSCASPQFPLADYERVLAGR
jgi:hypothetical protein